MAEDLEDRLNELEIKYAYAQETIESLNEQVTKQWTVIDRLTRQIGNMTDQMETLAQEMGKPQDEPPPPHY